MYNNPPQVLNFNNATFYPPQQQTVIDPYRAPPNAINVPNNQQIWPPSSPVKNTPLNYPQYVPQVSTQVVIAQPSENNLLIFPNAPQHQIVPTLPTQQHPLSQF